MNNVLYDSKNKDHLIIERFVLGPLEVNTYLLYDLDSKECLIIDPGDESPALNLRIKTLDLKKCNIFLTHGHADHILGVTALRRSFGAKVSMSQEDAPMLSDPMLNLSAMLGYEFATDPPDLILKHGDTVNVGRYVGEIIAVPGHTRGGLALRFPGILITGDTLFESSIGRSDLPGGDGELLIKMIKERLLPHRNHKIFPGHGPYTSTDKEITSNPFLL